MRIITLCTVILVCLSLLPVQTSLAVPAAPVTHTLLQPDGTVIYAKQWGDERSHGWETDDGYSIVHDRNTGKWFHASRDNNGRLAASVHVVGKGPVPQHFKRHLRPARVSMAQVFEGVSGASSAGGPAGAPPLGGTANIPVILINFNNTTTSYSASNFDTLLFGTGNKSMKDYYEEVSYGVFSVSAGPGGVAGWYTASNTHNYYGADYFNSDRWPGTLVREAVQAADGTFDFAPYDQDGDCYVDVIDIVHQGSGQEASGPSTDIWSHRWNLNSAFIAGRSSGGQYVTNDVCPAGGFIKVNDYVIQPEILWGNMQTMGVFAHEYGHALGLPDLYDTDNSSEGIGNWGLMASGSWNYVLRSGDTPAHMSAWSKIFLGWITPVQVAGTLPNEPMEQASTASDVYQFLTANPSEYFLVENRQKTGFDAGLPGAGLAIWHIDDSKANNDQECYPPNNCTTAHYKVALVQADNIWHLEKNSNRGNAADLWYLGNKTDFDAASNPNSNLYDASPSDVSVTSISASASIMTATLSVLGPDTTPPVPGPVTTSNTQYNNFVDSSFDLTSIFTDIESIVTACEYCLSTDGTCDTEWVTSGLSGSGPAWTCTQSGITGTDGQTVTLNMRASSSGGIGTGTAVSRTIDALAPTTSDNASSVWTSSSPVYVDLSAGDGAGSGTALTTYCVDTSNSCTPGTTGTSASASCAGGSECTQYVRYFSTDNVGNQELTRSSSQIRQDLKTPADGTLSASHLESQIDLQWSGFSDSGSGLNTVNTYKLVYSSAGFPSANCTDGTEITAVTTQINYSHNGLNNGTTYYYRICAYDNVGNISSGTTASETPQVQYQLTTMVNPVFSGDITPDCSGGCTYDSGTIVILTAAENTGYYFDYWTNCDFASANVCTETMDAVDTVTANFQACPEPVRIDGVTPSYYPTLQAAYDQAVDGDTIQSRTVLLGNDLNADKDISVSIQGGYNCTYSAVTGTTAYNGLMTINNGTVTIGDFVFGN